MQKRPLDGAATDCTDSGWLNEKTFFSGCSALLKQFVQLQPVNFCYFWTTKNSINI